MVGLVVVVVVLMLLVVIAVVVMVVVYARRVRPRYVHICFWFAGYCPSLLVQGCCALRCAWTRFIGHVITYHDNIHHIEYQVYTVPIPFTWNLKRVFYFSVGK